LKKIWKHAFLLIFIGVQLWFIYITFHYPFIGIYVDQNSRKEWVISGFEKEAGPELTGKFRIGDIVRKIDGNKPDDSPTVQSWRSIQRAKNITISRNGEEIAVSFDQRKFVYQIDMLPLVGETISLLFALFLYMKAIHSVSAKFLSLVFFNIAAVFFGLGASSRGDALGKMVVHIGLMLLPIVFLHFLIVFFKEKGNIHLPKKFLSWVYCSVFVVFLSKLAFFIPSIAYFVYRSTNTITISYFLFGSVLNFVYLAKVYMKYRKQSTYLSTIIKTIWFSLFISFSPFAICSFLPILLYNKAWLDPYLSGWFILFFPVSFAYLIISKQLYDIDIFLRRVLFTIVIAVIPSAAITGINVLIFSEPIEFKTLLLHFLCVLAVLSFILYSLEYFTTKLERVMFPRKYHLQKALKNISKNLGSISSFRELKDIILVDIVNTLQVFGGAVVLKYQDNLEIIKEGDIDAAEVERLIASESLDDSEYTSFEVTRHEEYTSYLIMTKKKTNTMLGLEDRQWLGLIISYLAVSLENVHLIRKMTLKLQQLAADLPSEQAAHDFVWFRKLMFELQEKERVRIATDLHDTTMQDLFFLKKRFTQLFEKGAFRKEDHEQMQGILGFIDIINMNLRQSCFDLHPYLLQEIGLIETIQKLVDREAYECPFEIEYDAEGADIIEYRDLETKRHLFRIVQELLNNAKKHSQASKVSIRLKAAAGTFFLLYEDNGVGFDLGQTIVREIGSNGMGMEQMKTRVLYLNGHLQVDTAKGRGVKIEIALPMKEGLVA
jgi:two-component system sensor histidine kinase ComP